MYLRMEVDSAMVRSPWVATWGGGQGSRLHLWKHVNNGNIVFLDKCIQGQQIRNIKNQEASKLRNHHMAKQGLVNTLNMNYLHCVDLLTSNVHGLRGKEKEIK